jgi:uncharacterized membrane protein YraQ (UPF0718 family)
LIILDFITTVVKEFLTLTIDVLPYFILGVLFGALLEKYSSPGLIIKYLGKGTKSIINASLLGSILPGCSCATIPMAGGLKAAGAPVATVTAFIMVSPLLSPHTLVLNYGMLGWEFTLARILFSLAGAISLGLIVRAFETKKVKGFVFPEILPMAGGTGLNDAGPDRKSLVKCTVDILKSLGKYFLLGMLIASFLTALIPDDAISRYTGGNGPFAYIMALVIGIPLYVCEGEEIPITLALLKLGLGPGPAFTFLLGSIGTCVPTLIMAPKVIGRRPTMVYLAAWLVFALTFGVLFGLFY